MLKSTFLIAGVLALMTTSVQAEALPDSVFAKQYVSCMGGMSDQQDPQRAAYCGCIRDEMKKWDSATLNGVVTAQAQSGSTTQSASAKIDELAQTCIGRILK